MEKWIYVIAISLQLTGASLLILKYWFGSVAQQLKEISKKRTKVIESTLVLGDNVPNDYEFVKELWLSRIAFVCIAMGYVVGVFGNIENYNRWKIMWAVIICSIILTGISYFMAYRLAKKYKKNKTNSTK